MIIEIPVHPLSLKIIAREYNNSIDEKGILKLVGRDLLNYQLSIKMSEEHCKQTTAAKLLTSSITVNTTKPVRQEVRDNIHYIGLFLYKQHVQLMLNWIDAQVELIDNVSFSIRNFFDYYDIEEGDFDSDTAYKMYQRSRNQLEISKNSKKKIDLFINTSKRIVLDENDIYTAAQIFVSSQRLHFLKSQQRNNNTIFKHELFESLLIALFYDTGKYRYAAIARHMGKEVSSAFRKRTTFQIYCMKHRDFKEEYNKVLSYILK